jgi:nicotinamide mononucleotide transporter
VVLSLWMVERNMRVRELAWPLAIASSFLYLLLFRRSGLYGEAALQLLFIAVSAWGWWQWRYGTRGDGRPLVVRDLPLRGRWIVAALTLIAWPLVGLLLDRYTDSTVPYADALPTVASVAGQWLLARKYVQNWPTWLMVNVYSVGLFAHKALWLTAVLYAVFALLSVIGWRAWRRLSLSSA